MKNAFRINFGQFEALPTRAKRKLVTGARNRTRFLAGLAIYLGPRLRARQALICGCGVCCAATIMLQKLASPQDRNSKENRL
jgi:hypothetical protein